MAVINKEEFNNKIFSRIEKLIADYNLIENGDNVAIALSGGKDSVLTLHALANYQNNGHKTYQNNKDSNDSKNEDFDFNLTAISVDEGIEGYRQHGIEAAVSNAEKLGIKLIQKSFKDELDFTLDNSYHHFKSACIPCGVFRRNILNKSAYKIGANKLATGHNLDDEIQSFLMSFARADTLKFSKFGPMLDTIHPKLIPRIKPLWNTPEKDVGTWAVMNNINIHLDECPYSSLSLRGKTKEFLNKNESKYPGTKENIMESFKKTILEVKSSNTNVNECERCGEPSSRVVCMACEMENIIKNGN
ncbi:TIGR00269 family protein [Methanobrevibacter sp. TMH8]|uniref:TIGR00269 family protein n=1 Tax=Methanobrevibacter sp. TMH8 TaxID=2848611 RepID=UPI001CCB828C|nr:TIGR00269 family protein [Methanobrevibacter sp. TMH8]MBZ9571442.1 TIGR00269 family protein [Methanobrevibacter sp. TMH8]